VAAVAAASILLWDPPLERWCNMVLGEARKLQFSFEILPSMEEMIWDATTYGTFNSPLRSSTAVASLNHLANSSPSILLWDPLNWIRGRARDSGSD